MITGTLLLDDLGAHYPVRTVAPQVLFDFESGITGWYTPLQANAAQEVGIDRNMSTLVASAEQAYQGSYAGKWTFVDDVASGGLDGSPQLRRPRQRAPRQLHRARVYAAVRLHGAQTVVQVETARLCRTALLSVTAEAVTAGRGTYLIRGDYGRDSKFNGSACPTNSILSG
jgi:hypothetical protein